MLPTTTHFDDIWQPAALMRAFGRARRAKRGKGGEPAFYFELERNIAALSNALRERTWRPDPYRYFIVRHTKERRVAEATFRDRVVHHALVAALEPPWEARFSPHSYACRREKGQHAALRAAAAIIAQHKFALTLDIHHYFDHVDHGLLLNALAGVGADDGTLWLCATILAAASTDGVGIPIGNLTSQFWANAYLDAVDHVAGAQVGDGNYLRYMDDMLLVADDKASLWRAHAAIATHLQDQRRLALKSKATRLLPVSEGVPWLGMRLFTGTVRLQHEGRARLFRKLAQSAQRAQSGALADEAEVARARSLCGHLQRPSLLPLRRAACAPWPKASSTGERLHATRDGG